MGKLNYLMGRLLRMNYRSMFDTIGKIHDKTGKNRVWLFSDMVNCGLRYGAGYKDYMLCEFYNLTDAQRKTYVTRGVNNRIVKLCNDPAYYHCVEDKNEFNSLFAKFVHRGWLDMEKSGFEEFARFMEDRDTVISKPTAATCGKGIEKLSKGDFGNLQQMYDHLKQSGSGLIEDFIIQHPDVSKIYPDSVNTYRIVTVTRNGNPGVVYAFIRIGNGGRFVDNINSGGMAAPVDVDTGVIQFAAFDKDSKYYAVHPATGCPIAGYQLPYWKESIALCLEAAKVVPQLGYVGWDVAVSQDGPQLIEGNHFPGHDILQMPPHVPDKVGMLPRFREFIPEL
jgi:glutathione synthase/RimK-type ligase-like ATP-grasp enzyme